MHARADVRMRGFTLVELLVALAVMAMLAVLSWRGLDGMGRVQSQVQTRTDDVLALQAGLGQWSADLEALVETKAVSAVDYNGQVLRLTRRDTSSATQDVLVVGWSRHQVGGRSQWVRWQSPPVQTRAALQQAWMQAERWAQNPSDDDRTREVPIAAADDWQVFYFRSDAWTNPLSAAADAAIAPAVKGALTAVPDGVRLVLTLSEGQAVSGKITRDWVRPIIGGGKS